MPRGSAIKRVDCTSIHSTTKLSYKYVLQQDKRQADMLHEKYAQNNKAAILPVTILYVTVIKIQSSFILTLPSLSFISFLTTKQRFYNTCILYVLRVYSS